MVTRVALLTVALFAAVVPTTAQAYWDLSPTGDPLIFAWSVTDADYAVAVCAPGASACTPVAGWTGGEYAPGETVPGTTFELTLDGVLAERSPVWQGRVQNTAPPTLSGTGFAGGEVAPVGGTWSGGWGDEVSSFGLAACATPQATGCVPLPAASACRPCIADPPQNTLPTSYYEGRGAVPPALTGRYLFATEFRLARDQRGRSLPVAALPPWSLRSVYDLQPARLRHSVSAPIGIGPAPVAPPSIAPPPAAPTVTLRERALRSKGRISVGRIACAAASCKVAVKVSGGGKKAYTKTFTAKKGVTAIIVPARRGKLTVRVHVDGNLITTGKVTAR
jgi:hypothetical protein